MPDEFNIEQTVNEIIVAENVNNLEIVNSPNEIIVSHPINEIVISDVRPVINIGSAGFTGSIGPPGPQGVPGPPGPAGPGSQFIRWVYSTQTGDYTIDFATDTFVSVDTSTHPVLLTLPLSSAVAGAGFNQGWGVYVQAVTLPASYFPLLVQTTGGQLITFAAEGFSGTTYTFESQQILFFHSNGTGYEIVTGNNFATYKKLCVFYDVSQGYI